MKGPYSARPFRKILVPVIPGCDSLNSLKVARAVAGEGRLILVGLVKVEPGRSLSVAAEQARELRGQLKLLSKKAGMRTRTRVSVAHTLWEDLAQVVEQERPDLLLLEWPCHFTAMQIAPAEALTHPPCDVALVRGPLPKKLANLLIPIRGGPHAELALRLSLSIAANEPVKITTLHLTPQPDQPQQDAAFQGIAKILASIPEIEQRQMQTTDPAAMILAEAGEFDLLVAGTTVQWQEGAPVLGPVVERLLAEGPAGVIAVKTRQPAPLDLASEAAGQTAISVLVDKWFAENTFHADEFSDLEHLLGLKRFQNLKISLALPALNESATVGNVIRTLKSALVEEVPLLDEIVLVDSNSVDQTREIAASLDIPVVIHQEVLPQYGARTGKGEALWKSLYVTSGDIILWIDTDIVNIHPRFVYGLLGPLLVNPGLQFVKGFYRRPIRVGDKVQAGGGGRVTELTARPLLNLFYPELSGIIQPLSGEYGGRRSTLEKLTFYSGYGVEIGLLIDVFEKCGLSTVAQVDLEERIHHNQPLESLSMMSFAIIQAVIQRLEQRYRLDLLEEVNKTMKLIRYEPGRFFLDVEEIAERSRPPMIELPEYLMAVAK
jgi:glucosyl-3-phosphoglycerate synthase